MADAPMIRQSRLVQSARNSAVGFLFVVTIIAGCDKSTAQAPSHAAPTASLAEQRLCAEGAEKSFTVDKKAIRDTYTNHYDAVSKTCYVEVTVTTVISLQPYRYVYSNTIYDAFENRIYGDFGSESGQGEPDSCNIEPREQPKVVCKSQEEFDQLALRYFGTTAD